MMNFPGVIAGDARELAKLAAQGAEHVDGHAPGVLGRGAERLRGGRDPLRPRGGDARGGARAAARRDVAADPRGVGGAEPRRRSCRSSREFGPAPDGVLHRRPRAGRHRRRRAHQRDGARGGRARGRRPRTRSCCATLNPARWHGLRHLGAVAPGLPGRPARPARPRVVRAGARAQARARRSARSPAATVPEWVRHAGADRPLGPAIFAVPGAAGAVRVIGLVPDQIVTESLVDEPTRRGRRRGRRPRARPGEDRRRRAAPRHGPRRRRVRPRLRAAARRARLDGRARRAQPRRASASTTTTWPAPSGGCASSAAASSSSTAARCVAELPLPVAGPALRRAARRGDRASRALHRRGAALGCAIAAPFLTMAFLALSVIPALKITDRGLVDVERFELVPLAVE